MMVIIYYIMGFPDGTMVKNPPDKTGDARDMHRVAKIPWKWQPTPAFLPGKCHGQRSLAGFSAWGYKELDTMIE